jgi:conjugal transfer ATP-binding protein TraC
LGDKIVRTFFVISYPRFFQKTGSHQSLILIGFLIFLFLFIRLIRQRILRYFQKKVAEVQSQINEGREGAWCAIRCSTLRIKILKVCAINLQQAQEKLFDVGLYISIYGETDTEFDKIESEIKSILESKLIYVKPALFQQEQGFRSILPMANDELSVNSKINSSTLSSIFPFVSFDLTSDKGILYGINRHNSSLVLFDRFSLENYNSITFAKSGSGKSYTTKLEILRTLMFDTEVIVIDPEREYEYLAEAAGGRYFNISLNSEHHINPFELPPFLKMNRRRKFFDQTLLILSDSFVS